MTDYTELANRIVGHDVGYRSGPYAYGIFLAEGTSEKIGAPSDFVRDGRVVLAMLQQVFDRQFSFMIIQMPDGKPMMTIQQPIETAVEYADPSTQRSWASQIENESLAIAILTACCEALDEKGT